ncbi:MAG: nucleotidyltransferase [Elusimicrobiota bacterium]
MQEAIKVINELKEKRLIKDYAIGGGIAAIYYIEPFLTYDLDIFILITKEDKELILLTPIYNFLESKGYHWKGEHIVIGEMPVQLIPADELEEEAIDNARKIKFEGIETKVIKPEYLIPILLRAGREKDKEKITKLLEQADVNRAKLDKILIKYHLTEKFKKIIG